MRVETGIPMNDWSAVGPAAQRAEALGYDSVVTPEVQADPFVPLAFAAVATERIQLGTGIAVLAGKGPQRAALQRDLDRSAVRYRVAFYGSTRSYHGVLAVHGQEELGMKLHAMSKRGQWKQMAAEISDDLVRTFAAVGTHEELPKAIAERFGGICDTATLDFAESTAPGLVREILQDVHAIPCAFEGHPRRCDGIRER